ncbi:MAG: nicotinate-nucleotide adenylyltransferase [Prevotella sp.]|nr:nicotinate-nucleotide adenylyltransferase [Prevotella sp.]
MRIGIFGGSFNPIHRGHIELARQLRSFVQLDEIWLMVSPQNPLKQGRQDLLDDQLRYQMARLALRGEDGILASSYELHLPKPSYTWNTLQHLRDDYPQHAFTLLIGGDNWEHFHRWYRASDIMDNYDIVVYPRRGSQIDITALPPRVLIIHAGLLDISSTEIRQRVQHHQSVCGMVPAVIEPIVRRCYQQV